MLTRCKKCGLYVRLEMICKYVTKIIVKDTLLVRGGCPLNSLKCQRGATGLCRKALQIHLLPLLVPIPTRRYYLSLLVIIRTSRTPGVEVTLHSVSRGPVHEATLRGYNHTNHWLTLLSDLLDNGMYSYDS